MKKIRIILVTFILLISVFMTKNVFAEQKLTMKDMDNNYKITMPSIITNGKGTITVLNTTGTLYYQFVEMTEKQYNNIKSNEKNLKTAIEAYKNDKTEEKYNTYVSTYETYINDFPKFSNDNWIKTNGDIEKDVSSFSDKKYFVLWAKLVENDKVTYDVAYSSLSGTKKETTDEDKKNDTVTTADFSNAKIKFETTSTGEFKFYKLVFDNVTYKDKANYYVYITHSKNKPNIEYGSNGKPSNPDGSIYKEDNTYVKENKKISALLEEYGDIYVWVVEYDITTGKSQICLSNKKVDRPKLNSIGNRLKGYFFNDKTNIFCYEDKDDSIKRKMNVKIGVVKDIEILKSIQKGKSDSLSKLMDYAKANKPKYTTTFDIKGATNSLESIAKKIGLTNREYYYVYMYLDDENNKYYGIEDVSLYQASIGESIGYNLFDYLSDEFKWNLKDSNKKGNTTSNTDNTTSNKPIPFTGTSIAVITSLVVLLISALVFYYKNQKYKDVK